MRPAIRIAKSGRVAHI